MMHVYLNNVDASELIGLKAKHFYVNSRNKDIQDSTIVMSFVKNKNKIKEFK